MSSKLSVKPVWTFIGRLAYTLAHPLFYWMIRGSKRVRVAITVGDEVLVVKNWLGDGNFRLPGGGIEANETWQEAAVREIQEELGLEINPEKLEFKETYTSKQRGGEFEIILSELKYKNKPAIEPHTLEITKCAWVSINDKKIVAENIWSKILRPNGKKP